MPATIKARWYIQPIALGFERLAITEKFKPSVFAGIAANPSNEAAYLLCGITLVP